MYYYYLLNYIILNKQFTLLKARNTNLKTIHMKKTTQNFTNVKVWQSIMVAFVFLFSLTTFSQTCPTDKLDQDPVVGDQLGENIMIQATSMSKSVVATIPWSNSLEDSADPQGDLGTAQTGASTNYNWVIATGHFTHNIGDDGLQGDGGNNYLQHDDIVGDSGNFENWVITPTFDLSAATSPELNYWDHVHWQSWAEGHEVFYSTDYADNGSTEDTSDVTAATWILLTDQISDNVNYDQYYTGCGCDPTNVWDESTFALPSESTVTVAFKYTGDNASDWLLDDISVIDTAAAAADWTVTPNGVDATISISVDNFTIGAAGDGYDGHWHYTLDGGSEVMVYDTNDVVLTGLANGVHTLVAWLTDDNHQALDPAVEETITFATSDGTATIPWSDDFETGDFSAGWTNTNPSGAPASTWLADNVINNTSGGSYSAVHYWAFENFESYLISPTFDLSGSSDVVVSYSEYVEFPTWADTHTLLYSEDYVDDVSTATWVVLNDVIPSGDTWHDNGPYALPTTGTTVNIAFRYTGNDAANWHIDDVSVWSTLSIDDVDTLDMIIYPNPVDGNYVTITSPVNGIIYVEVFDINGRKVIDTVISNDTLDVSSINSGFYMIKVTIDGKTKISKLVVR